MLVNAMFIKIVVAVREDKKDVESDRSNLDVPVLVEESIE